MWHEVFRPAEPSEVAWSTIKVKEFQQKLHAGTFNSQMRQRLLDILRSELSTAINAGEDMINQEAMAPEGGDDLIILDVLKVPACSSQPAEKKSSHAVSFLDDDDDNMIPIGVLARSSANISSSSRGHGVGKRTVNHTQQRADGEVLDEGMGIAGPAARRTAFVFDISSSEDDEVGKADVELEKIKNIATVSPLKRGLQTAALMPPPSLRHKLPFEASSQGLTPTPPVSHENKNVSNENNSHTHDALLVRNESSPSMSSRNVNRKNVSINLRELQDLLNTLQNTATVRIIGLTGPTGCSKISAVEALVGDTASSSPSPAKTSRHGEAKPARSRKQAGAKGLGSGLESKKKQERSTDTEGGTAALPSRTKVTIEHYNALEAAEEAEGSWGVGGGLGQGIGTAIQSLQRSLDGLLSGQQSAMGHLFDALNLNKSDEVLYDAVRVEERMLNNGLGVDGTAGAMRDELRLLATKGLPVSNASASDSTANTSMLHRQFAAQQSLVLEKLYGDCQLLVQNSVVGWARILESLKAVGRRYQEQNKAQPNTQHFNVTSSTKHAASDPQASQGGGGSFYKNRKETPAYFNTSFSWGSDETSSEREANSNSANCSSGGALESDSDLVVLPHEAAMKFYSALCATPAVDAVVLLVHTLHDTHSEKLDLRTWLPSIYFASEAASVGGSSARSSSSVVGQNRDVTSGNFNFFPIAPVVRSVAVFTHFSVPSITESMLLKQMIRVMRKVAAEKTKKKASLQLNSSKSTSTRKGKSQLKEKGRANSSSSSGQFPSVGIYDFTSGISSPTLSSSSFALDSQLVTEEIDAAYPMMNAGSDMTQEERKEERVSWDSYSVSDYLSYIAEEAGKEGEKKKVLAVMKKSTLTVLDNSSSESDLENEKNSRANGRRTKAGNGGGRECGDEEAKFTRKTDSKYHPLLRTIAASASGDIRQAMLQLQWACLDINRAGCAQKQDVSQSTIDDAPMDNADMQKHHGRVRDESCLFSADGASSLWGQNQTLDTWDDSEDEFAVVHCTLSVPLLEQAAKRNTWTIQSKVSNMMSLPAFANGYSALHLANARAEHAEEDTTAKTLSLFRNETLELAHATARLLTQKYTLAQVLEVLPSSSASGGSSGDCPPHKIYDYFTNNMPRYFDVCDTLDDDDCVVDGAGTLDFAPEKGSMCPPMTPKPIMRRTQLDSYAAIISTASLVDQWIPCPATQNGFLRSRDTLANTTNGIFFTEGSQVGAGGGEGSSTRLHDAMGVMGLYTLVASYRALHRQVKVPRVFAPLRPPPFFHVCFPRVSAIPPSTQRRAGYVARGRGGAIGTKITSYDSVLSVSGPEIAERFSRRLEELLSALAQHNTQLAKSIASVGIRARGGSSSEDDSTPVQPPLLILTPYWDLIRSLMSCRGDGGGLGASPEMIADAAPLLASIIFGIEEGSNLAGMHSKQQTSQPYRLTSTSSQSNTAGFTSSSSTTSTTVRTTFQGAGGKAKRTLLFPSSTVAKTPLDPSVGQSELTTNATTTTLMPSLPPPPPPFREGVLEQLVSFLRQTFVHNARQTAEELLAKHEHFRTTGRSRWGKKTAAGPATSVSPAVVVAGGFDCIRAMGHQPLRMMMHGTTGWNPALRTVLAASFRTLTTRGSPSPFDHTAASGHASTYMSQHPNRCVNGRFVVVDTADKKAQRADVIYVAVDCGSCAFSSSSTRFGEGGGSSFAAPHVGVKRPANSEPFSYDDPFDLVGAIGSFLAGPPDVGTSNVPHSLGASLEARGGCTAKWAVSTGAETLLMCVPLGLGIFADDCSRDTTRVSLTNHSRAPNATKDSDEIEEC